MKYGIYNKLSGLWFAGFDSGGDALWTSGCGKSLWRHRLEEATAQAFLLGMEIRR